MFPVSINQVADSNILYALEKYFDKDKHMDMLMMRLYKNHNKSTRYAYQKFATMHYP